MYLYIQKVGIYKRKQEIKKTNKHALDQESHQEKRINTLSESFADSVSLPAVLASKIHIFFL